MRKNGLFLFNYRFINTVLKVPVGEGVYTYVFGGNVTDDDEEDVTNGEVAAVGEGVKKNDFDVIVNDGDGEDVTIGEGVNENVLGDGEADILFKGISPHFHRDNLHVVSISFLY